jgi:hypothetical protein
MKQSTYEKKYKSFLSRIRQAKKNNVTLFVVAKPQELGDTYEEIIESLNRLADADLNLAILPTEARE